MNDHYNAPDPECPVTAREIQRNVHSALVILGGSQAAGFA